MPALTSADRPTLEKRVEAYGCTDIIRLDQKLSQPEQLDYLDLLPRQSNHTPLVSAVAEHQGVALLYLVEEGSGVRSDAKSLAAVCRQLANRSDPAWLGVVKSGSLEIFPIGFHGEDEARPIKTIEAKNGSSPLFFQSLVHGTFEESNRLPGTDYVYGKIFDLLTQTIDAFVPKKGRAIIDPLEVLSMAGRALFFRFLIDRRIVLDRESTEVCPDATELKDAFSSPKKAAQTSAWLDATFNGDFLKLIDESIPADDRAAREKEYLRYYRKLEQGDGKPIFVHLNAILQGWRTVGDAFQKEIDWGDLDFEHIPVGVLSQVYESFSHRADPRTAKDTSVHYTPRTIASLMVEQSFAAMKDGASAKVLDPACGAGIFLVLAFRRLIRERWQRDGERPKTSVIQEILYQQIRGFDISESALRLAALALYITAIELNGSPRPPQSLRFPRNLRDEVLYRFGNDASTTSTTFSLGSLGPSVSQDFDKIFDIVIGNPPWTRLRNSKVKGGDPTLTRKLNSAFTKIGQRVLYARGLFDIAKQYRNPDNNPDLPFLWRATEWAKEGGVISLAMHPRIFTRTERIGRIAWVGVMRSIQVTGILNGADLRNTRVWEGISIPFSVLFFQNAMSAADYHLQFASPVYEPKLNVTGRFRIDYESSQSLCVTKVQAKPWIFKTLSLGSWLDVELMEQLTTPGAKTLISRWLEWDPAEEKTGEGFNRAPNSSQKFVDFLAKLPVFSKPAQGFSIEYAGLKEYGDLFGVNARGLSAANRPRQSGLFQPPLVIVPRAPGDNVNSARAYISRSPIAFSKSYYGYSCEGHPEAETLAALIYLLAHSTLFRYYSLMVSISIDTDRMLLTKKDFDTLPFPDITHLATGAKSEIRKIADRLEHDDLKPWRELNSLIFRLYGLDEDAVQVAEDTLFSAASYRRAGRSSLHSTSSTTRANFSKMLCSELDPYFDVCNEQVAVKEAEIQENDQREPWLFLAISREGAIVQLSPGLMRKAMDIANSRGCSRIIVHSAGKRGLLLGLLNQQRWWTITRARLCAQHIIRNHLGAFGLEEDE